MTLGRGVLTAVEVSSVTLTLEAGSELAAQAYRAQGLRLL